MLVELFDLHKSDEGYVEWKVSARWLKYEEDVEGVDHYWGRPHVSFLLLRSFYHFKLLFDNGIVVLDPQVTNFDDLVRFLKKTLESEIHLEKIIACTLINLLSEKKIRYSGANLISRVSSKLSFVRNPSVLELGKKLSVVSLKGTQCHSTNAQVLTINGNHVTTVTDITSPIEPTIKHQSVKFSVNGPTMKQAHHVAHLTSSVASNSSSRKCSNEPYLEDDLITSEIFVAEIEELPTEIFVLLRLPSPMFMPELTGQSGMLHFLCLLAGPLSDHPKDRHEMGRVMATLMADKNFHRVALLATNKAEISTGIDCFLESSTLIPPGKIDDRSLFSPENLPRSRKVASRQSDFTSALVKKLLKPEELKPVELVNGDITEAATDVIDTITRNEYSSPSSGTSSPFVRTGKPFGGMIRDIKNRWPFYLDDFRSGLNFQCVTSILFIFFANFAVAVAMGEALAEKTGGLLGVTEVLVSHAICGTIWALFGGQPLCIVAAVGPFLVFEGSLFQFCHSSDLDYLAVRFWTGLWTFGFTLLMAMVEVASVMRFLTRFTEDIYTLFIAAIFVWEGGKFVYDEFQSHPLRHLNTYCQVYNEKSGNFNCSPIDTENNSNQSHSLIAVQNSKFSIENVRLADQPDTAFLSLILFLTTFLLAFGLKRLRTSIYFGRTIRKSLGDFGVPLAVVIITAVDVLIFQQTYTRHVNIKDSFDLTSPQKRSWIVNPLGTGQQPLPLYMIIVSMVPAFLASVLIFAQTEIVEILLSKEERRLKKPSGFHLDLVINGVIILICSILGIQWLTPAAVQSLSHAASLTVMKKTVPGETPEIDYVIEQRVTLLVIAMLHGVAAFMGSILILIPTAALFGLFLYLGVMGLLSTQLWHRMVLYFVPHKYFPNEDYSREVRMRRMHFYTTIQLACFMCLWVVKMFSSAALAFPFVLVTVAALRKYLIRFVFTKFELDALEGKQHSQRTNYEETEKDFYDEVNDKAI